jgi:uncharacterized protein
MQTASGTAATHHRQVFVDTQGWAEVFHAAGLHHPQAAALMQDARLNHWELFTSNLILSELAPLFRSRNFRLPQSQMLAIIAQIRALPNLVIVHIDPLLDQQAWELLDANPQHPWSHVDATSMIVMRQIGVSEIVTADHHFIQAGFSTLL